MMGRPRRGGILRVGLDWEVDIIDPPASFGGWNTARVVQQMFESLVEDDLEDEASLYTLLVPALAAHYDISSDGRRYKFRLRNGVRFHDGTPFNAAAVIFNFDRIRRPEAPQFSSIAADYNQMAMQSVKDVRALDEQTVEIILREPFPEFLRCMTQEDAPGSVVFISPTALKSYGNERIADHAPGTGPFKFARRFNTSYGSSVEIVRNDDYWAGPPHLDGIRFTPFPSADDRAQMLLDGEVDLTYGPEPTRLGELREKGFIVSEGLIPYVWYFIFNTRDRPFRDARVRRAIICGFDRQRLSDTIFNGATRVTTGILPPASPSYEADFPELYPYDLARAKGLLAEAGYPNGLEFTIVTAAAGSAQLAPISICESMAEDLAKIGIKVNIDAREDWVSYCEEWRLGIPEGIGLSEMSWGMSCDVWIEQIAHSRYLSPKGFNAGYYSQPQVDKLLDLARTSMSDERRIALYRQAHRRIMEDASLLPVVTVCTGMVVHAPYVKNLKFPRQNWHDFKRVWIDREDL
jgi:peptide/nickel transport system substrate-binding protein